MEQQQQHLSLSLAFVSPCSFTDQIGVSGSLCVGGRHHSKLSVCLSLLSLACKASTNLLQRDLDGAARALSDRARGMVLLLKVWFPLLSSSVYSPQPLTSFCPRAGTAAAPSPPHSSQYIDAPPPTDWQNQISRQVLEIPLELE